MLQAFICLVCMPFCIPCWHPETAYRIGNAIYSRRPEGVLPIFRLPAFLNQPNSTNMKLHLPKLLLVAVVAAAGFAQATDHNVGTLKNQQDKLPSNPSNYFELQNNVDDGFELSGSDRLGYIVNGTLTANFGKEEWTKTVTKFLDIYEKTDWKNNSKGDVTPNVKVNGTLTVKGNAEVKLGGQYKQNTRWNN